MFLHCKFSSLFPEMHGLHMLQMYTTRQVPRLSVCTRQLSVLSPGTSKGYLDHAAQQHTVAPASSPVAAAAAPTTRAADALSATKSLNSYDASSIQVRCSAELCMEVSHLDLLSLLASAYAFSSLTGDAFTCFCLAQGYHADIFK